MPSLETQLLERASLKLLEPGDRLGLVGEQVEVSAGIPGHLDRAVVDAIVDPVSRGFQRTGELRHRQRTGNVAWMRLSAFVEQALTQADAADGAWQDLMVLGRPISFFGQQSSNLLITLALPCELEGLPFHFLGPGQALSAPTVTERATADVSPPLQTMRT